MTRRVTAVLGAGALGLTLAHRLVQRGEAVVVLEREPIAGGLAAGFQIEPGLWLERFYHHLFRGDRHATALIAELGLGPDLVWRRPRTVTFRDGAAHQLDSAASLLRFRPLAPPARLRLGVALAGLRALPSPGMLEGRTAAGWIRRWMGRSAFEVVWEPLLRGKFGVVSEDIALPWFWARVHDRTAELGYLRGGFQRLYDRLAESVRDGGGIVQLGTAVREVRTRSGGGFVVETSAGPLDADRVVSTLAVRLTCRLVPELPQSYRDRHEWGAAYGAHCLVLSLDRPLTDSYWMNLNDPGFPFMSLVEHTNFIDAGAYGGRHLVYLGNYRPMDDPLMSASTSETVDQFAPHLERLNPAFRRSWIAGSWSFAAPFAQPIVTTEYRAHIPGFRTPIPGLWVASMFQVYPHDRGQNYSIDLANRLAAELA